jgi:hypothetical protein
VRLAEIIRSIAGFACSILSGGSLTVPMIKSMRFSFQVARSKSRTHSPTFAQAWPVTVEGPAMPVAAVDLGTIWRSAKHLRPAR